MKPADLVDAMLQGIERAEPEAVVGRRSTRDHGFTVRAGDTTYAVRVERLRGFWDAEMMDDETGAGMFDDQPGEEDTNQP